MADEKKYLRRAIAECRSALSDDLIEAASAAIHSKLIAFDAFVNASAVILYAPVDNEVATGAIAASAFASRRPVFYPRLDRGRHRLELARVAALTDLKPGAFGIPEPCGSEVIEPEELDRAIVCVPGLAFTPAGERLGRGGGHYDRLLALVDSSSTKVGLAYSFQMLDSLPQSEADERLDFVVTQSAIHECSRDGRPEHRAMAEGGSQWR